MIDAMRAMRDESTGASRPKSAVLVVVVATIALALTVTGSAMAQRQVPRTKAELTYSFSPIVKQAAPAVVNVYVRSTRRVAIAVLQRSLLSRVLRSAVRPTAQPDAELAGFRCNRR